MTDAKLASNGAAFLIDAAGSTGAATGETSAVLSNGDIVVVWTDSTGLYGDLSGSAIVAKIIAPNGSVVTPDFLVNTTTTGNQGVPAVTALAGGGFTVAWEDLNQTTPTTQGSDVRAQVFTNAGVKTGGEILVSSSGADGETPEVIAGLSNGGFVVQFNAYQDIFAASGARSGSELQISVPELYGIQPGQSVALSGGDYESFFILSTFNGNRIVYSLDEQTFSASGAATSAEVVVDDDYLRGIAPRSFAATLLSNGETLIASDQTGYDYSAGKVTYNIGVYTETASGAVSNLTTFATSPENYGYDDLWMANSLTLASLSNDDAAMAWVDEEGLHVGTIGPDGLFLAAVVSGGSLPTTAYDVHIEDLSSTSVFVTYTDSAGEIEGQSFNVKYVPTTYLPKITGTEADEAITDAQTDQPFAKVVVTDQNTTVTSLDVSVTLSAPSNGALSDLSGGSYDAATGVYTFTGSAAAATAALDALTFDPTAHQVPPGDTVTTDFTISVDDFLAPVVTNSTTSVVVTAQYNPPTVSGGVAGQTTLDTGVVRPFSTVTVSDPDNPTPTLTVTVRLSAAANGTLSNLSGGAYDPATGSYTFSGTAVEATAALRALAFTPTEHQVAANATVTTTFSIGVTDGQSPEVFDAANSVVTTGTANPNPGPYIKITGTDALVQSGGTTTTTIVGTVSESAGVKSVAVYNGTTKLGEATVNSDGSWSLAASFAAGTYDDITAVATDADNASATADAPFSLIVGLTGSPYASQEKIYDGAGDLVGRTYFSANGSIYLAGSVEQVSYDEIGYVYAAGSALSGQSYNSYEAFFSGGQDNAVYLGLDYFFTGPGGDSFSSYVDQYSGGNELIGSRYYYTGITGKIYTGVEYDYTANSTLDRIDYTGVTGTGYSSYEYDFVGGVFSGAKYEVTSVASGASYSSYELDYNAADAFSGYRFFFTNLPGQPYTGLEEDFDANAKLTRVILTGVET